MVIHATAVVSPSARVGEGCEIGPFSVVGPDVVLGRGCRLLAHAVVLGPSRLGEGNVVHPGAVLGGEPQDLKFAGERTELEIGDRNVFREGATVNRGTGVGGGVTRIGSGGLFMSVSHVAHDCRVGDRVVLANAVLLGGHVVLEDDVIVSGATAIHHFVTVGTRAFVGGMSRVTQDVPPYTLVEGNPCEVRGLNRVGLSRSGIPSEAQEALRTAYRVLFREGLPFREAAARLRTTAQPAEVGRLLESLERAGAGRHGRALEAHRG